MESPQFAVCARIVELVLLTDEKLFHFVLTDALCKRRLCRCFGGICYIRRSPSFAALAQRDRIKRCWKTISTFAVSSATFPLHSSRWHGSVTRILCEVC